MRVRKTCARQVLLSQPLVDCQETKLPASKNHSSGTIFLKKNLCSLQDEDFHESQFHVDHKSLLGCHRDDDDEDAKMTANDNLFS